MPIWIAQRTLDAVNDAICADGGNAFRRLQGQVLPHIGDAYREDGEEKRSHLGASQIGGKCVRAVYYGHRWTTASKPRGRKNEDKKAAESRMRRLWNRGHLEEGRFIAMLLMIGVAVYQQDADGNQYRISAHGGHFAGSGDGILLNVPDLPPGVPCLGEFKTHGSKSFDDLITDGVKESKPEHYAQMQIYMHHFGLMYALYVAVNKDTDDLHMEIVMYDRPVADFMLDRAHKILFNIDPPPRPRSANPGYFMCKSFCDHTAVCYHTTAPLVNCRTCSHIRFREDGTVRCGLREIFPATAHETLDKDAQLRACADYTVNPKL